MDINKERLEFARKTVQILVDRFKQSKPCNPSVEVTMDRKKALKGADAVLVTILSGGVDIWRHDIEIPMKYGISFNVGDTRGIAGIFRALRTIPDMLDICRDMEKLCPNALMLNYTNPMAMLCRAMQKATPITVSGLCHSVQGTARMLANWAVGNYDGNDGKNPADMNDFTYVSAGINHQSWYINFKKHGKDMYPALRKAMENPKVRNTELVRNEMFMKLGYYVTESSGHTSEYSWWFRKRPDLIKKWCLKGQGNPGRHALVLGGYLWREKTWKSLAKSVAENTKTMPLSGGHEYAASIINAIQGGDPFEFNGNVPNKGIIPNLMPDACIEVPVVANARGLNTIYVGNIPPQCAALNNLSIAYEEMAVEAALTGNKDMIYHAAYYCPLSAAVLSLSEIEKMVTEMLQKNKSHLSHIKGIK
jgi:alpha-galactosidase